MRESLVQRAKSGDEAAFTALVDLDGDRCYAIAYRILRDVERAQDVVQQAFLMAWRDLPRLRDVSRYEVWLYRLVTNACFGELRRGRRWTGIVRPLEDDVAQDRDEMVSVDERDALARAFRTLSPEHRAVVVLHHHAGLPLASIAEALGVPIGTVKSRLHYATRALRDSLSVGELVEAKVRSA